jgi:peptidoglycan/LPS O-acetylase OafA/YrhL
MGTRARQTATALSGREAGAQAGKQHVPALDGIRGIAIGVVLLFHLASWAGEALPLPLLTRWTSNGRHGVDLFFVLSGYLITGILWDTRATAGYFKNFYVRRTLRIFPVYYLVVLGVTVAAPLLLPHDEKILAVARQQGWLWSYAVNLAVSLNRSWTFYGMNHFWSLAVEEQFYLLWPLLVWRTEGKSLVRTCQGLIVLAVLARAAFAFGSGNLLAAYSLMPCRMDSLLLGGLLALEGRGVAGEGRPLGDLLPAAALLLAPILVASEALPQLHRFVAPEWEATLQPTGWAIVGAGLIAASERVQPVAQLLQARWLRFLGRYSYGLYVYHHLLRQLFERVVPLPAAAATLGSETLAALAFLAAGTSLSIGVSLLSFHQFEARFLNLKRRFEYAS